MGVLGGLDVLEIKTVGAYVHEPISSSANFHYLGRKTGFTLIELSIVLVIIGLIVGGVLAGRYLIRASELASIITDEQRYITAVNTFRTKYNELPGDMADATNYWGADPGGCPNLCTACYTGAQTKTCNGNGNGLIEDYLTTGQNDALPGMFEDFRAWQQLSNAGLVQGGYTGTPGPAGNIDVEPGLNVPQTKMPNGGFEWTVFSPSNNMYAFWGNPAMSTQYLLLGSPGSNDVLRAAFLTPADAQSIDLKLDDGLPQSGTILSWVVGSCTVSTPIVYNITYGSPACTLLFMVKAW